jgi:hypothetical protein
MIEFEYIPLMYAVDLPSKIEKLLEDREIWTHNQDHILQFWEKEEWDIPFIEWLRSYKLKPNKDGCYIIALYGS